MKNGVEMYRFETANFVVSAEIYPDEYVDTSWDETGETQANLESGLWCAFGTIVTVETRNGTVLGEDSIWGSIYENPSDFFKERNGYFRDLVRQSIHQARANIVSLSDAA